MKEQLHMCALIAVVTACPMLYAGGGPATYQEPAAFIEAALGETTAPKKLWLTKPLQARIKQILGHTYGTLRLRYWEKADRRVFILEEIGKEKPITTGLVVKAGKLERVKVLIFRESRGWEVKSAAFTEQFSGATLKIDSKLDRDIDGITGATLSVRAVTKLSRMALLLDSELSK
jgi:hypothetical protein